VRWRDLLLFCPTIAVATGAIAETQVSAPWADLVPFSMSPLSAAAIIAYLLLERRELPRAISPTPAAADWSSDAAAMIARNFSGLRMSAFEVAMNLGVADQARQISGRDHEMEHIVAKEGLQGFEVPVEGGHLPLDTHHLLGHQSCDTLRLIRLGQIDLLRPGEQRFGVGGGAISDREHEFRRLDLSKRLTPGPHVGNGPHRGIE
jgi:hypothetical protein